MRNYDVWSISVWILEEWCKSMRDISREQALKELDEKVKQLCEIYYEDGRKIGLFSSEECEGAVSKKAILEMLVDIDNAICDGDGFQYQEWHTKVDELPNAQLKNKWIPVSERLPTKEEYIANNGLFIVSDGNRTYAEYFDVYNYMKYFGEPTMNGFRVDRCVTAWMPLPQPYKAESEE